MGRMSVAVLGLLGLPALGGCDRIFNLELIEGTEAADASSSDARFGLPIELIELSTNGADDDPTLTDDLLEMYFNSDRAGGNGGEDIWYSSRPDLGSSWELPINVGTLSTAVADATPRVRGDGKVMYLSRSPGTTREVYISERPDRSGQVWSSPMLVGELNSDLGADSGATITADGLAIYFASNRRGNSDIYVATRAAATDPWTAPTLVAGVNSDFEEDSPNTRDGKTLYFNSDRPGSLGLTNIWRATRASTMELFRPAEPVDELNSSGRDQDPWLSPDGRSIWYASDRGTGSLNIFTASQ